MKYQNYDINSKWGIINNIETFNITNKNWLKTNA